MAKFVDAERETWIVRVDVAVQRRVKELAEFDIRGLQSGHEFVELATDSSKLVAVLYAVCLPQIKDRALSEEQFASRFAGDVLEEAADALLEAIIDFFPKSQRAALAKLREATSRGIRKVFELAERSLDIDELEAEIERRFHQASKSPGSTS